MPEPSQKTPSRWRQWGTRGSLEWGSVLVIGVLILVVSQGIVQIQTNATSFYIGMFLALLLASGRLALSAWESKDWTSVPVTQDRRLATQPLDTLVSLLNVSRAVITESSFTELGQIIVDSCRDCFECDEVSLMMLDTEKEYLEVRAFAGHRDRDLIRNARVRLGESVAGKVAETRTPMILGAEVDSGKFQSFQVKVRKIQSAMIAPIIVKGEVIGVLNASASDSDVTYTDDDLRVLCILAEHAGIVAQKAEEAENTVRQLQMLRQRHGENDQRSAA